MLGMYLSLYIASAILQGSSGVQEVHDGSSDVQEVHMHWPLVFTIYKSVPSPEYLPVEGLG
jgi:hypothetical protein